jgi:hypothetical protein
MSKFIPLPEDKRHVNAAPRKASESAVAGSLARLLKVPEAPTVGEVCRAFIDFDECGAAPLFEVVDELYAWEADIATDFMGDHKETPPLIMELLGNAQAGFIVKDSRRTGHHALWFAVAAPPPKVWWVMNVIPSRGLFRTIRCEKGDAVFVVAIQLHTLFTQKST